MNKQWWSKACLFGEAPNQCTERLVGIQSICYWVILQRGSLGDLAALLLYDLLFIRRGTDSCTERFVAGQMSRTGQIHICTPYMTVYLVIFLPKIPEGVNGGNA